MYTLITFKNILSENDNHNIGPNYLSHVHTGPTLKSEREGHCLGNTNLLRNKRRSTITFRGNKSLKY